METIGAHLPQIWLCLIGFFLLYYVVTDGTDLGVGMISLLARDDQERGLMMETIGPVWHNHQTWLVLLGGMLFGAFPVFYAVLLSSLYVPMVFMLLGLILRGVSFEFRAHSERKRLWGLAFGVGSLITAVTQGLALGGLLGGLELSRDRFVGDIWGFVGPFSLTVTAGVIVGYLMLGCTYLHMKTDGRIRRSSLVRARRAALATLAVSVAVHVWSLFRHPVVLEKWTSPGTLAVLAPLLGVTLLGFGLYFRDLARDRERAPFVWNAVIILCSFSALSIALYPHMIPSLTLDPLTVQSAAASPGTLGFMLAVIAVLLPVILTYTVLTYRIFRGKVQEENA
jgi:cytochrome d ubiquinol oxidase subunit II